MHSNDLNEIVGGPYLFVNKDDTRKQRTVCIQNMPCAISIRHYESGSETKRDENLMVDLETAFVRLITITDLYNLEGYEAKGIGRASRGEAPKVGPQPQAVALSRKAS